MKLAIFGLTGRTGRPLMEEALKRGHTIRALVRNPAKLGEAPDGVEVVVGDVTDREAVASTVEGCDAVLSVIGPTKGGAEGMLTAAGEAIVAAMDRHNVQRVITLTGAGVPWEKDEPKLFDRFIRFLLRLTGGKILDDSIGYTRTVMESGREWTVVRGPMLTEAPGTGTYRVGYAGVGIGPRCSRANLASFILDELEQGRYVKDAPAVSDAA